MNQTVTQYDDQEPAVVIINSEPVERYVVLSYSLFYAHMDDQAAQPEEDKASLGGNLVQQWIDKGWQPLGPPMPEKGGDYAYQVMIRRGDGATKE